MKILRKMNRSYFIFDGPPATAVVSVSKVESALQLAEPARELKETACVLVEGGEED